MRTRGHATISRTTIRRLLRRLGVRRGMTPGRNVQRYVAGVLDATPDRLAWVTGDRKNSGLFIALLKRLLKVYAGKRVIHVILDNYMIRNSAQTRAWLAEHDGRIRLHFLLPYCPDDNRIERCVWREVHASVTRNHTRGTINEMMDEMGYHLTSRNRAAQRR